MNYIKKIKNYLETCNGKIPDVLFEVYTIIETLDCNEQINAFQFFCENNKMIESDGSNVIEKRYFTEKQVNTSLDRLYEKGFADIIDSYVNDSIKNNDNPNQFYEKLWLLIQSSKICKSKRDRVIALFFVIDSKFIPYKNVGLGKMMDEYTYSEIIDSIDSNLIEEIEYIIKLDYEQKTQKSSLLLERLLSINDKDKQLVLFSIILDAIKNNTKNKLKNYLNKI